MEWIVTLISSVMKLKFTGSLQINFSNGVIKNVKKTETLRELDEKNN